MVGNRLPALGAATTARALRGMPGLKRSRSVKYYGKKKVFRLYSLLLNFWPHFLENEAERLEEWDVLAFTRERFLETLGCLLHIILRVHHG